MTAALSVELATWSATEFSSAQLPSLVSPDGTHLLTVFLAESTRAVICHYVPREGGDDLASMTTRAWSLVDSVELDPRAELGTSAWYVLGVLLPDVLDRCTEVQWTADLPYFRQLVLSVYQSGALSGALTLAKASGVDDGLAMQSARGVSEAIVSDDEGNRVIVEAFASMVADGFDDSPYAAGPVMVYKNDEAIGGAS